MSRYVALTIIGLLFSHNGWSKDMEAVTSDGRRVLLKDDNTWTFVTAEQGQEEKRLVLEVIRLQRYGKSCRLGLKMSNNTTVKVTNIVFHGVFAALSAGGLAYAGPVGGLVTGAGEAPGVHKGLHQHRMQAKTRRTDPPCAHRELLAGAHGAAIGSRSTKGPICAVYRDHCA